MSGGINTCERNTPPLFDEHNFFDFTRLPDLDPFEMFDPQFNLDSVDAYLDGYLGLNGPVHLG